MEGISGDATADPRLALPDAFASTYEGNTDSFVNEHGWDESAQTLESGGTVSDQFNLNFQDSMNTAMELEQLQQQQQQQQQYHQLLQQQQQHDQQQQMQLQQMQQQQQQQLTDMLQQQNAQPS